MKIPRFKKGQKWYNFPNTDIWVYRRREAYYYVGGKKELEKAARDGKLNTFQHYIRKKDVLNCVEKYALSADKKKSAAIGKKERRSLIIKEIDRLSKRDRSEDARIWEIRKALSFPKWLNDELSSMKRDDILYFIGHSKPSELNEEERSGAILDKRNVLLFYVSYRKEYAKKRDQEKYGRISFDSIGEVVVFDLLRGSSYEHKPKMSYIRSVDLKLPICQYIVRVKESSPGSVKTHYFKGPGLKKVPLSEHPEIRKSLVGSFAKSGDEKILSLIKKHANKSGKAEIWRIRKDFNNPVLDELIQKLKKSGKLNLTGFSDFNQLPKNERVGSIYDSRNGLIYWVSITKDNW